jgi:hypothetical protein
MILQVQQRGWRAKRIKAVRRDHLHVVANISNTFLEPRSQNPSEKVTKVRGSSSTDESVCGYMTISSCRTMVKTYIRWDPESMQTALLMAALDYELVSNAGKHISLGPRIGLKQLFSWLTT